MARVADKIMKRVRARGRGKWVCIPGDFLDLGSRAAVHQALSRLAKNGDLRRVGRGLYDLPRMSRILNDFAPVDMDSAVAAVVRRSGIRIMPPGIEAANGLGLTNAVPANGSYLTDGATQDVEIDNRTVRFRHVGPSVMAWKGRPSAPVMQALRWLGPHAASDKRVVAILRRRLPDAVKEDLARNSADLPGWSAAIARKVTEVRTTL